MSTQKPSNQQKNAPENRFQQLFRNSFFPAIFILIILYFVFGSSPAGTELPYSTFKKYLNEGKISSVVVSKNNIEGEMPGTDGKKTKFTTVRVEDNELVSQLEAKGIEYRGESRNFGITQFVLTWVLPIVLLFVFWSYILRRMGGAGEQVISFGKNRA
jgi:cell division protease FtsH